MRSSVLIKETPVFNYMTENKKTLNLEIDWKIENYNYLHKISFDHDRIGHYTIVSKKNIELTYPQYLYKFCGISENEYNLNSLLEGYFYFSKPKDFNDPFDCLSNRERYIINGANDKSKITQHRENIGVCCFSLINDNPLMWGHYTNNYNGYCLKFENKSLLDNKNIAIKNHVSYLKNYQPHNDEFSDCVNRIKNLQLNKTEENRILSLLTMEFEYCWKYYDWKYEQEYRAISITSNSFERKIKFEKNSLKEIYIGYRMKNENQKKYNLLLDILKNNYPKIKIFEVNPSPTIVKLNFEEIQFR